MTDLQQEGAEGNAIEQKPADAPVDTATEAKPEVKAEGEAPEVKPEEQWPKKAVNALSKRERQIGKLRAELEAMKQQHAQYQQPQKTQPKQPPKAADYSDADEYYDARAEWKFDQKIAERQQETAKTQEAQKTREYMAELEKGFVSQVEEAKTKLPDFEQVRATAIEEIDSLPPHITQVCLEAEDGVIALYQAAKEGKINELAEMSPVRAAAFLTRMGDKAKASLTQPKPVTKAPEPVTALKGTSKSTKSPDDMSGSELLKWLRS